MDAWSRACTKCGEEKPLTAFYRHPFGRDGRQSKCIECAKADTRSNRAARIDYYREYERSRVHAPGRVLLRQPFPLQNKIEIASEPEKRAARIALGNAVRDKRVLKAPHCQVCGVDCDAHGHHDDYSKPLDVIWCCTACHALIHAYWRAQVRGAA